MWLDDSVIKCYKQKAYKHISIAAKKPTGIIDTT